MEELADQRRLAHRPRCADADAAHRAVDPEQSKLQAAGAFAASFEIPFERGRKHENQTLDVFRMRDGLGKMPFGRERRDRQARRDRLLDASQRLVEADDEGFAETAGKRRARRGKDRSDRSQPDTFQTRR